MVDSKICGMALFAMMHALISDCCHDAICTCQGVWNDCHTYSNFKLLVQALAMKVQQDTKTCGSMIFSVRGSHCLTMVVMMHFVNNKSLCRRL